MFSVLLLLAFLPAPEPPLPSELAPPPHAVPQPGGSAPGPNAADPSLTDPAPSSGDPALPEPAPSLPSPSVPDPSLSDPSLTDPAPPGPGDPPPSHPEIPFVPPVARCQVDDARTLWENYRDECLLALPPAAGGNLSIYEHAPDRVEDLLTLLGYEGDFAPWVRQLALRRLRRTPKLPETLERILEDRKAPPLQRAWAADALGELGGAPAVPALAKQLASARDLDLRGFSALALARIGTPKALEAVAPLALDHRENEDLRCLVLLALGASREPLARQVLARVAFRDLRLSARRAAIFALGSPPASPGELGLLKRLAEDSDPNLRAAALIAQRGAGAKGLQAPQAVVRASAALGAGLLPAAGDPGELGAVFQKDPDPLVRACAALALGRAASDGSLRVLRAGLAAEPRAHPFLRAYALLGLGLSHKPGVLPDLLQGLDSRNRDEAVASALALSLLGNPGAAGPLVRALESGKNADLPEAALLALAALRRPEDLPRLLSGLQASAPGLRQAAALACAVYGNPEACPALEKLFEDRDAEVRASAALAFDLLGVDEARPLVLPKALSGFKHRSAQVRCVGPTEVRRQLNRDLPREFQLPLIP